MDKYHNHFHITKHLHLRNFLHNEYNDLVIADTFRLLAISMVSLFIPIFLLNSSFSILEVAFMELGVFFGAILFHFLTLKFLNAFGGVKRVMIWSYVIYILMYLALRYTDFLVAGFGKGIFLMIIASSALFFSRDIKTEIDMSLKKSFNFHNPRTNIIFFIQGLGYAAVGFIWPILLFLFSIELISMGFLYLFSNIVYAAISYFGGKKTDNDHSNLIGRVGAVGHGFSMIFRALSTTILAMTAFQTMGGFFGGLVHIAIDADFFRNSHKDMANAIMCREIFMNLGRAFLVFILIILLFYFPVRQVFIGALIFSGFLTFILSILIKARPNNEEIECCE